MKMFVAHSPEEWKSGPLPQRPSVISVGNFDGLHLGHQKIIRSLVAEARNSDLRAAVITFDPHPMKVLRPNAAPALIESLEQRLSGLEKLGLDAALVLKFDVDLARVSAEDFIRRILMETVQARKILVGSNFRFGHKHAGDVKLLQDAGATSGFEVEIVPPVELEGAPVSSTRVRQAVSEGRVAAAAKLLGRHFALTGGIKPGDGRGSTIVFPTLNLAFEQELLPGRGVYATRVLLHDGEHDAVTNVGVRPTFDGHTLTVESHLLDFSETVREGRLEVRFIERLREEQKFGGAAELRAQIGRDIEAAIRIFERAGGN
jgi:riboflavin kinase/FMN adenylyltransferase